MKLAISTTARFTAIAAGALMSLSAAHAATTDIAPAPLANASTAVVKPNLMFILDDSASMDRDHMPDWIATEEICKDYSTSGVDYLRDCSFGDPAYNNAQSNAVYYNPNVTYKPPVQYNGTLMKSYNSSTLWKTVPNDGYGVQFTGTVNLLDNGIPDYVWCSSNSPSSSNREYGNLPNSQCKWPIEGGLWNWGSSSCCSICWRATRLFAPKAQQWWRRAWTSCSPKSSSTTAK